MRPLILPILLSLLLCAPAFSDEEASNRPLVKSSEWGSYYAKSVPDENYGSKGKTFLYAVEKDKDNLFCTFDWYANQLHILDNGAIVVRLGPWARGHQASPDHLAIAFYKDCKELKSYSTLDIAGTPSNVSSSVSHYQIFEKIAGFRWIVSDDFAFDVTTHDGRTLSFDPVTGGLLSKQDELTKDILYKVTIIKGEWWYLNREKIKDANSYEPTIDELKSFSGDRFPVIPAGYRLAVESIFKAPRLEKEGT
jgi:hypothetical protein